MERDMSPSRMNVRISAQAALGILQRANTIRRRTIATLANRSGQVAIPIRLRGKPVEIPQPWTRCARQEKLRESHPEAPRVSCHNVTGQIQVKQHPRSPDDRGDSSAAASAPRGSRTGTRHHTVI